MKETIKRPDIVKVFASKAVEVDYLPVKFATNRLANGNLNSIANENFEYGLESLEGTTQPRDLQSVLHYLSANLSYLFQQGVAEFSPYQNYPANSLVQYNGALWLASQDVPASLHHHVKDLDNPCAIPVCEMPEYPSKAQWCKIITSCTYDNDLAQLEAQDQALNEAISNLKGVESIGLVPNEHNELELKTVLSDGSHISIPMVKFGHIEVAQDGSIHIANADGSKITLDKPVYAKELDQQKGFYWNNNSKKWEVNLADFIDNGSGLEVDRNGNVKVKPTDFIDDDTLHVKPDGKIEINPTYTNKVTKDLKDYTDNKTTELVANLTNTGAKIYTDGKGLQGSGQKTDPLKLKLGHEFTTDANGNLILASVAPQKISNLNTNKYNLGFHTFNGYVNTASRSGALGLPKAFNSQALEADRAMTMDDYVGNQIYDFNGYYIASDNELIVWVSNAGYTWIISNDSGVNSDGTLKDNGNWTKWKKLDNAGGVTDQMIKSMQDQINALNNKVQALEQQNQQKGQQLQDLANKTQDLINKNNETCKVPVKNVSSDYTIVDTDNTIVVTSSSPVTITLDPDSVPVGRLFTIIQAGTGKVTLKSTQPSTLHAPLDGSLVLAGTDAVVTVLFELGKHVRIFGQTG